MAFTVNDHTDVSRYELREDGQLVGFAAYILRPDAIVFTHTEVADAYAGRGLGAQLAREALDDSRAQGRRVVPRCSFIAHYIERHPDYADLLA